jgi:phosphohistidine phosphatase
MALYLVQHGRARPKSEDPLQGLSEEGAADVRRIAEVAAHYCVRVSVILHSGKARAAQTASILAAALHPPKGVRQIDGINPLVVSMINQQTFRLFWAAPGPWHI